MIIPIDAGKASDNIHYSFFMKTISKLRIRGNFLNLIKNVYKRSQLLSYLMVRNLKFSH